MYQTLTEQKNGNALLNCWLVFIHMLYKADPVLMHEVMQHEQSGQMGQWRQRRNVAETKQSVSTRVYSL